MRPKGARPQQNYRGTSTIFAAPEALAARPANGLFPAAIPRHDRPYRGRDSAGGGAPDRTRPLVVLRRGPQDVMEQPHEQAENTHQS